MVVLEHVSKIFNVDSNKIYAVNDVSYHFDNQMYAICGKSGSGKSTLLHLIGGLDRVSTGHIYINDIEITKLKEKDLSKFRRQNIGFVFQFFNLIPELTVSENIKFVQQISKTNFDKNYYEELISTLGLQKRLNHLPNQLSGGQKQRVAIARALISKPSLLLLDEPTGNLDSESSEAVYNILQSLRIKFNQAIIVVTHDTDLANKSDKIITLRDGQFVFGG